MTITNVPLRQSEIVRASDLKQPQDGGVQVLPPSVKVSEQERERERERERVCVKERERELK